MDVRIDTIKLGKPANWALMDAGIETLEQLTQYTEKDLLSLHGFGPKALGILKTILQDNDLLLKEEKRDEQ